MCIAWDEQAKKGNTPYAQWFWTISRLHFIRAFMKNVDILNWSWSARKCAAKNHWINHAVHYEWTILQHVLWREEQTEQKKAADTHTHPYHIIHFHWNFLTTLCCLLCAVVVVVFVRCCWWISNKATYCFRSRRYSSIPILCKSRLHFRWFA